MKRRLLLVPVMLVSLASTLMLGGCGGASAEDLIREDLQSYFGDIDAANETFVETLESSAGDELKQLDISAQDFADAFLGGFGYDIGTITVDGDTATAQVTVSLKSYSDIMTTFQSEFTDWMYGLDSSEVADMSEEDVYKQAGQMLIDVTNETEATQREFEVVYTRNSDGDWEMDSSSSAEMATAFFS